MVLLMNLVTMTPGTISLDFEESPSLLRVHFLFDDEVKDFQRKLDEYYLPFLQAVIPC
jgi:multisubunit Na+/H+ antiporter MnhE subunit